MKFNTSVSTFMTMVNEFSKAKKINKKEYEVFLQLLNPFAPHMTEELWERLGHNEMLAYEPWPKYDEEKTIDDLIDLPIQVNGKLRANIQINKDEDREKVKELVHQNDKVQSYLEGKEVIKEIYVPNRIYILVIK